MRFRASSLLILSFALIAGAMAQAQPIGVKNALEDAYKATKTRRVLLNDGAEAATDKDKAIANAVAEWYVYRLTHRGENLLLAQSEFTKELTPLLDKKNEKVKRKYADMLGAALVDAMKNVLARDITKDPQMTVHAAQMLSTMAKLRQDKVSAFLIELIEDKKTHDAVRLHAIKALKEAMPVRIQQEVLPLGFEDYKDKDQNDRRKHDARNVDALAKYIERPIKVDNLTQDDVATLRFLRREAIVALASAGAPAVTATPNKQAPRPLDGPVAPTLMLVISKASSISPPPGLQEKVEAALGLCGMEHPFMPEYNSDLAVYFVGLTLIEFSKDYNKDWNNFAFVGGKGKQLPYLGWKSDAKRFQAGLKSMEDNTKKSAAAVALKNDAKGILDKIATYNPVEVAVIQDFEAAVARLRPKSNVAFKTVKSAPIPLP